MFESKFPFKDNKVLSYVTIRQSFAPLLWFSLASKAGKDRERSSGFLVRNINQDLLTG